MTIEASELTQPYFGEIGYAPMFPYMVGEGRGFTLRSKYKIPEVAPYSTATSFTGFFNASDQPVTTNAGTYLQLVPEVYYRPAGLSGTAETELWTRVEENNLEYTVLSNLSTDTAVRENPTIFFTEANGTDFPSFLNINIAYEAETLYSTQQKAFDVTIQNLPSGLQDIKIDYQIYLCKPQLIDGDYIVTETPTLVRTEVIRNITFTSEKTDDYVNIETDDEGNEIPVPVNDPAALWSCNRVLNHYGKLMAYGSLIHPERIFIGHPTFIHYFPYYFTRDFDNDAQEPLQQITPFMNILVVQSETYTWGLKGIDAVLGAPNFYTPFVISPIYGTIAPKSVRPVRNQLFFLSQDGIVSIQSLYAIDEQYNVKHIDKNIENIVPLDPEAVAIQYDNQYWINFPNTPNNMTLRYHVDLKAWMKDTYFEYNGLDEDGKAVLSETIFNGVYKYIREDDKLVIITNPMRLGKNSFYVDDDENYRIMRLYVDYSIATDVKEVPRALFETSFLDQDYAFNEKKYLEEKLQFTIQNEYHLGKEPIFRDESMAMVDIEVDTITEQNGYTLYQQPLNKNHDYEIIVPRTGLPIGPDPEDSNNVVYPNVRANIKQINVRLFDIQGNLIDIVEFKDNMAPMPSIYNLRVFPSTNTITFNGFNNDIVPNTIFYSLDGQPRGSLSNVPAFESRSVTLSGVQFGLRKLELFSTRQTGAGAVNSDSRVLFFQMPDGQYDEDVFTPIIPSLSPVQLSAVAIHVTAVDGQAEIADRIIAIWNDQNDGSEKYRYRYRKLGGSFNTFQEVMDETFTVNFTQQEAIDNQLDIYEIEVEAFYENQWSAPATFEIKLENLTILPTNITDLNDMELTVDTNERIKFYWTDVENESSYQLYYKYANDTFANLAAYPEAQKKILNAGTELYLFDTNGNFPNMVQIPKNAIIEVLVRPVNNIGPAPNDATRQGVYRAHYPIDPENALVIEPINGQAGFKVTIPEALKTTATASNYVFETAWDIEYYDTTTDNAFSDPPQNSLTYATNNTKNYFEVLNLEPNREYRVRFRGVYTVNGVTETPLAFQTAFYITATTGNATPIAASQPSITDFNYSYGTSAGTATASFNLRNNHSTSANLYYQVRTSATPSLSSSSGADGVIPNVAAGTTITVSGRPVNDDTTYYVHALADNGDATLDSPITSTTGQRVKDWITATFSTNGGTPPGYSPQNGYEGFTVVSPGSPSKSGQIFVGWSPSLPKPIFLDTSFTATYQTDPGTCPAAGTAVFPEQTQCDGTTLQILRNDGNCGTYWADLAENSETCGYVPPSPPAAPASVSISSPGNNQIAFNWSSSSGATSYTYRVHYAGSVIETNTIGGTSATATVPAGSIFVSVAASNANGTSSYTSSATITVSGSGLG